MKLSEWAALGEVIGTIAVFVSLLFVVYSINQNTVALQGSSENILFEMHADLANHFISDASMAKPRLPRLNPYAGKNTNSACWSRS